MVEKLKVLSNTEREELAASLEAFKRKLPLLIEHASVTAKLRKASYDAHIRNGFTPAEALELCHKF